MSASLAPGSVTAPSEPLKPLVIKPRRGGSWRRFALLGALLLCGGLGVWMSTRSFPSLIRSASPGVPTATVKRGDLVLSVTAKGELRGGNPDVMVAPMTGGGDLHLTFLRKSGELIKSGETVAQFDTTEQEYKLKEAEADLAEAEQHVAQARAQADADQEEDRYALLKAHTDLELAELDVRKNPLLPPITARQNDLALAAARDHLQQLEQNLANRKATNEAAVAMQEAGRGKAESQASTARKNIDSMTLKAHREGYVSIRQNSSGDFFYYGMTLPLYQVGDSVRGGMAIAEIPDLNSWEVGAQVGELDRGHLAIGEPVSIVIIAAPGQQFRGHVMELGSTSGPPWNRRFECKIELDNPSPDLRPGMSAIIVVNTENLRNVLWLPAQALFENNGKTFVYLQAGRTFVTRDVKLLSRNETRVVISGLEQGAVVALANPTAAQKKKTSSGAAQPLPR